MTPSTQQVRSLWVVYVQLCGLYTDIFKYIRVYVICTQNVWISKDIEDIMGLYDIYFDIAGLCDVHL